MNPFYNLLSSFREFLNKCCCLCLDGTILYRKQGLAHPIHDSKNSISSPIMVPFGSDAVVKGDCWCFCYKLCVLEWLHSCQAEAWLTIYLLFFFRSLKIPKWRKCYEFRISLMISVNLSVYLLQKCYAFPSFQNFLLLCNTCGNWLVTCITQHCVLLKESHACERGEKKHQNIWNCLSWAICAQLCLQAEMVSVASVAATGQY